MSKLDSWETIILVCVFCALEAIASPAQTFNNLLSFNGTDGEAPYYGSLVQGLDADLYGTTLGGGEYGRGTIFKATAAGKLTTLYSFCAEKSCLDGSTPVAGLLLANNGNFYGTTTAGGAYNNGTVFKTTSTGTLTVLYSFCHATTCPDGEAPFAGLIQGSNGNLYGTTEYGGAHADGGQGGTVFEITPGGILTTLYSFCAEKNCLDGSRPFGELIQAANGNFYGTTYRGGTNNLGTVFEITPAGTLTTVHSFDGTDGELPVAGLVQAANGNFYGTTMEGGADAKGTVFEITPAGALTTLHSFDITDGGYPYAPLIQATDGNFYGTTYSYGNAPNAEGTVFKITPAGTLTTLHNFLGTDGDHPYAGLLQATNGTFYGTASAGGADNDGTVFSLSVGLSPFVKTLPASGAVGTPVTILGSNLTGATSVTFNGTAATFKIVSSTEITSTVPKGATTGPMKVKTPSGTLTSNANFQVP